MPVTILIVIAITQVLKGKRRIMEDGNVDWIWGKLSCHLGVSGGSSLVLFYTIHLLPLSLEKSSDVSCKMEDSRAPEGRESVDKSTFTVLYEYLVKI